MDKLLSNIRIEVPQGIYIKDPQTSALGQKIITGSIDLIDKIGFEAFTFKKVLFTGILRINTNCLIICLLGIGVGWNTDLFLKLIILKTKLRNLKKVLR